MKEVPPWYSMEVMEIICGPTPPWKHNTKELESSPQPSPPCFWISLAGFLLQVNLDVPVIKHLGDQGAVERSADQESHKKNLIASFLDGGEDACDGSQEKQEHHQERELARVTITEVCNNLYELKGKRDISLTLSLLRLRCKFSEPFI